MKKLTLASMAIVGSLFLLSSCHIGVHGSGVRKTERRELASFTAVETGGALEVEVTCQKPVSFEIEGDDNILPLIQTDVVDGVLRVKSTRNYHSRGGIVVRISVPNLERIQINGAGKVRVSDLKSDHFEIHSSGVVDVSASGQTKSLEINETGAGKIDTHNLRAASVNVSVSGAAGVDVYASDQLDVTVSGAAHVTYSGDPKVSQHISGAGSVSKRASRGV
jgi:putative autotransporter adhesin-like protein